VVDYELRAFLKNMNRYIVTICETLNITLPSDTYTDYLEDINKSRGATWNGTVSKSLHANMEQLFEQ